MSDRAITFRCQLSPIMSAIRMGGDVMRVSLDIPMTERENAIGLLALTDQPLSITVTVDTQRYATPNGKAKAAKEPKGPYSFYWEYLRKQSIETWPDFQEVLECDLSHVWEALHQEFNVDTMAVVGPRQFEKWIREKGMSEGLITLSKRAETAAVEKTDKLKGA